MEIKFLQAFNGDCIWITFVENGTNKNILIDGGTSTTYSFLDKHKKPKDGKLKILIETLKRNAEILDLVILTHIDDDHIDGFLKWFGRDENAIQYIKEIWFNSGRTIKKYFSDSDSEIESLKFKKQTTMTSVTQGVDFENFIRENGVWDEKIVKQKDIINWNNISFQILSPSNKQLEKLLKEWKKKSDLLLDTAKKNDYTKTLKQLMTEDIAEEDKDVYNGSSIAFILKKDDTTFLLLGDSHSSEILAELDRLGYNENYKLSVDLIKLSHHGSKKNNPIEIFKIVDTEKYIISTNGDTHNHPDKTTIARIVATNPSAKIYFNYPNLIKKIVLDEDRVDFPEVEYLGTDSL